MHPTVILSFSHSSGVIDTDLGIIKGVSLITSGIEVLGHNCYSDSKTNQTVFDSCSKLGKVKVKSNHGSDVGAIVGYLDNFRIEENQVKADLQLLKSSDQFDYILELAEKLSDQFGLSIAFKPKFEKINKKDFVRCQEIYSCDIVDAPACNPNGLFEREINKITSSLDSNVLLALSKTMDANNKLTDIIMNLTSKDMKKNKDEEKKPVMDTDSSEEKDPSEKEKEKLSEDSTPVDKDPDKDGDDDSEGSKNNPDEESDDEEMSNKDLVKLVKSLEARFIAGMPTADIQPSVNNSPKSSDVNTIACKNCQDTSHVLDSLNELHNTATVMIADHKKKIEDHNKKLNGFQDQLKAITDSISKFSEFEHKIKVVNDVVEALNNKLNVHQLEFEEDKKEFSTKLENQKAEFETQLKDADLLACRKLAATGVPISKIPSAEVALSVVNPMEQFNAMVNPVEKAQFWKEHGAEIKKAFQAQANKINTQK